VWTKLINCAKIKNHNIELAILDPNFKTIDKRIRIVAILTNSCEAESPNPFRANVIK